jgi:hypothetical protein
MNTCIKCGRDTRFKRIREKTCDICSKDAMEKLREQRVRDDPR